MKMDVHTRQYHGQFYQVLVTPRFEAYRFDSITTFANPCHCNSVPSEELTP